MEISFSALSSSTLVSGIDFAGLWTWMVFCSVNIANHHSQDPRTSCEKLKRPLIVTQSSSSNMMKDSPKDQNRIAIIGAGWLFFRVLFCLISLHVFRVGGIATAIALRRQFPGFDNFTVCAHILLHLSCSNLSQIYEKANEVGGMLSWTLTNDLSNGTCFSKELGGYVNNSTSIFVIQSDHLFASLEQCVPGSPFSKLTLML